MRGRCNSAILCVASDLTLTGVSMRDISCAILVGGKSSRLGQDKALLDVAGEPLIQRIAKRLDRITDDLMVVGSDLDRFHFLQARMVQDLVSGFGSLGGIYSALEAARHAYVFVAGCDMPFLDMNLVRYIVLLAPGYDVVMPYVGGEAEPLHAIYATTCTDAIKAAIAQGERRIISFLPEVRVREVHEDEIRIFDPDFRSFFNINTPEDLKKMRAFLAEGQH